VNRLVQDFLEHRLSRRGFGQALAALGIGAAGMESMFRAAEAVAQGIAPGTGRPRDRNGRTTASSLSTWGRSSPGLMRMASA